MTDNDVTKMTNEELRIEFGNAMFDCGAWDEDDEEEHRPYSAVAGRADRARAELLRRLNEGEEAKAKLATAERLIELQQLAALHPVTGQSFYTSGEPSTPADKGQGEWTARPTCRRCGQVAGGACYVRGDGPCDFTASTPAPSDARAEAHLLPAGTQELLANVLCDRMSDISEEHYCATWMMNTERVLWDMIHNGRSRRWGQGEVSEAELGALRVLSDLIGGWHDGERFVPLHEWLAIVAGGDQ